MYPQRLCGWDPPRFEVSSFKMPLDFARCGYTSMLILGSVFQISCQLSYLASHPRLPPTISKYSAFSRKMLPAVPWPGRPLQCCSAV